MAENLFIPANATRSEIYSTLMPQLEALVQGETDAVANLGNMAAALHQALGVLWTGFYLVKDGQLVLGPFQGPVACTRIAFEKGVCGSAWAAKKTIVVPDVEQFPGHIACSSMSRSEIVVPGFSKNGEVCMVLDIDSTELDFFTETDREWLEKMIKTAVRCYEGS